MRPPWFVVAAACMLAVQPSAVEAPVLEDDVSSPGAPRPAGRSNRGAARKPRSPGTRAKKRWKKSRRGGR